MTFSPNSRATMTNADSHLTTRRAHPYSPAGYCSCGAYTLKYTRSMHSTSNTN
jgi:hypothetical protein